MKIREIVFIAMKKKIIMWYKQVLTNMSVSDRVLLLHEPEQVTNSKSLMWLTSTMWRTQVWDTGNRRIKWC